VRSSLPGRSVLLIRLNGLVGTENDCQSAQKSALKGSAGDGNRLPVRREILRTKRTMRTKRAGDRMLSATPENARDMRDMRDKGPVRGGMCALSALMGIPILWLWRLSPLFHEGGQDF
jgi:hypothetical protein